MPKFVGLKLASLFHMVNSPALLLGASSMLEVLTILLVVFSLSVKSVVWITGDGDKWDVDIGIDKTDEDNGIIIDDGAGINNDNDERSNCDDGDDKGITLFLKHVTSLLSIAVLLLTTSVNWQVALVGTPEMLRRLIELSSQHYKTIQIQLIQG